ncbi:MAG: DUF202 domain-containing protein [Candidatus Melainabacteria bacterium]|nr:DUF202 domain-containing protein [Candidatus Melainabacteria bacterium]
MTNSFIQTRVRAEDIMTDETPPKLHAQIQVDLALSRTLLASDRTILAWIRTSLALFGFGFTLAKFIHGYIATGAMLHGVNKDSSRNIGVAMVLLGLGGLLGGVIEHVRTMKELNMPPRVAIASPALIMALALAAVGIYLIYDIFSSTIT